MSSVGRHSSGSSSSSAPLARVSPAGADFGGGYAVEAFVGEQAGHLDHLTPVVAVAYRDALPVFERPLHHAPGGDRAEVAVGDDVGDSS